jgi:O-antigen/teichoic acid export membrane protein
MALQVLAAESDLALYAVLIPRFGARGAAMGTLGSLLVTCSASVLLAGAPGRLKRIPPVGAAEPPHQEIRL